MVGDASGVDTVVTCPDESPSIAVATYNIRSGRAGGLESALRAMAATGVDLGILTETKITDGIYTRFSSGYQVQATEAASAWQGGVALFWRESQRFVVEDTRVWGHNVTSSRICSATLLHDDGDVGGHGVSSAAGDG